MPFDVVVFVNKINVHHFQSDSSRIRLQEVRWSDTASIRRLAREHHEVTHFSGIATLDEMMVDLAAELREELGTPGMPPEVSRRFRDKTEMKRMLACTSVQVPRFSSCSDRNAVQRLLFDHEKLILKPIDGQGARGVSMVESMEELDRWYGQCDRPEQFQAEQFIDGVLYHVNAVVCDGEIKMTASAPYLPGMANIDFTSGAPFVSVILTEGELKRRLEQTSNSVIEALALRNGVTHLECFVTPDDEIVFCEIAVRPGGGGIVLMIEAQYGVNYAAATLLLEMGRGDCIKLPDTEHRNVFGLMGFRSRDSGFLRRMAGPDLFAEEWIRLFRADAAQGDFVVAASHCTDYLGLIIFSSADRDGFERRRSDLYDRFYSSLELAPL